MNLKNPRYYLFWTTDALKGKPVANHYTDIRHILDNFLSCESVTLRNTNLQNILSHAITTTPFYKNLNIKASLDRFPVINKNLIRTNFESFRSDTFRDKPFIRMTTSGSTGTPFTVYQDLNKKARNYADTLYFANLAGYELGDKLYYFKIWSENNKISSLKARIQNIRPFDVLKLDDNSFEVLMGELINTRSNVSFLGYASAFDSLVMYLTRTGKSPLENRVRSIISISESLSHETRDFMSKFFDSPVVSRYSNLENGILAQQCNHCNEFHINSASYFIELFDLEKDEPVAPGTLGRIIVTSLFNYAMPLIRYDTGDAGILAATAECGWKTPVLSRIEGRQLDLIYDTSGNLVSSYVVYKNMWKYLEIKQYQLIQEDRKKYKIVINAIEGFKREKELISEYKNYLGRDANIVIEYVQEIPVLNSGKRKKVVNNWKK